MKITTDLLTDLGAQPDCEALRAFAARWPGGVELTRESVAAAQVAGLNVHWLGRALAEAGRPVPSELIDAAARETRAAGWLGRALARAGRPVPSELIDAAAREPLAASWLGRAMAEAGITVPPKLIASAEREPAPACEPAS